MAPRAIDIPLAKTLVDFGAPDLWSHKGIESYRLWKLPLLKRATWRTQRR
jgi:hypothetical protein